MKTIRQGFGFVISPSKSFLGAFNLQSESTVYKERYVPSMDNGRLLVQYYFHIHSQLQVSRTSRCSISADLD